MNSEEERLLAIHAALLHGAAAELAAACDPRVPDGVGLVFLPHGDPVAQVAFGTRAQVAREITLIAHDEGPAAIDLPAALAALAAHPPAQDGMLVCVVIALGRARLHEIPWPRAQTPEIEA
jgi:hypothetical protein